MKQYDYKLVDILVTPSRQVYIAKQKISEFKL